MVWENLVGRLKVSKSSTPWATAHTDTTFMVWFLSAGHTTTVFRINKIKLANYGRFGVDSSCRVGDPGHILAIQPNVIIRGIKIDQQGQPSPPAKNYHVNKSVVTEQQSKVSVYIKIYQPVFSGFSVQMKVVPRMVAIDVPGNIWRPFLFSGKAET